MLHHSMYATVDSQGQVKLPARQADFDKVFFKFCMICLKKVQSL